MTTKDIEKKHIPVLLNELVDSINIKNSWKNIIVDCTLWMGGHASEIIKKLNPWDTFIWFDADIKNLKLARERLENLEKEKNIKIYFINSNYWNLSEELNKLWINKITWIYYDLWLSSLHFDEADRWFSFQKEWPLDMRLNKSNWITAAEVLNSYKVEDLRRIFLEYGEEPKSNLISKIIVEKRKKERFENTLDLASIIPWGTDVKRRIFQAIRIEVNKELENLETSLNQAIQLLDSNWIIFVISFHSLEDRITKNIFKRESKNCICNDLICSCKHKKSLELLNKKPIIPSEQEIKQNPRSRSAKARFGKKI